MAPTPSTFRTIAVSGQRPIIAESPSDTLNIVTTEGVTATVDPSTDTLTIGIDKVYLAALIKEALAAAQPAPPPVVEPPPPPPPPDPIVEPPPPVTEPAPTPPPPVVVITPEPPVTEPISRGVLTRDNFEYRGMCSVGRDTSFGGHLQRKGYARGNLAGRRVNGELRLFITGSHADEWRSPIYEMRVPDTGWVSSYDAHPPELSIAKDWSDGARGAIAPLYPNGQPVCDTNGRIVKGLIFDPDLNGLWYSYLAVYNVSPAHDPSIGFIGLDDTTGKARGFGPWRHRVRSPYTGGYGFHVPATARSFFNGRELVFGAETATRGPMGFSLIATKRPSNPGLLPPDEAGDFHNVTGGPGTPPPRWSLDGQPAIAHGNNAVGIHATAPARAFKRPANFVNCGWSNVNAERRSPAASDNPGYISEPGGGTGFCDLDAIDSVGSAVYVDTGTKHGVICFGVMVWPSDEVPVPHSWYGPEGNDVTRTRPGCPHGHVAPTGNSGTGYYASAIAPFWWIFDPQACKDALDLKIPIDAVQPASAFDARRMHGEDPSVLARMKAPTRWYVTGSYYDPVESMLYVAEDGGRGWADGEVRTMIHAFKVRA
jgi:hypothetical protein